MYAQDRATMVRHGGGVVQSIRRDPATHTRAAAFVSRQNRQGSGDRG